MSNPTQPPATVALVGTLDTKGAEYQWVAEKLREHGVAVTIVDTGVNPGTVEATVTAEEVATAAGTSLDALRSGNDRGAAVTAMGEGAAAVLTRLHAAGALDGVLALGGSGGSSIAARAVRDLPVGLPKLIVSTMASGDVSPYVGASDVSIMYSVVDVAGINQVSRAVLGNAAAGIAGMARAFAARRAASGAGDDRPLVAASMFGVTTPAVDAARARLEELGYEVLVFHATGSGGQALEALARSGMLAGVLDLTTTELADDLVGGVLTAGPSRLTAAGAAGVPQVVSLGALDMVNFGPRDTVPERFEGRTFFVHNPTVTLMRTTAEENAELGRRLGTKLAAATGPTALIVPRKGVSALDADGMAFRDGAADTALFDAVLSAVDGSAVTVVDEDAHINDKDLAVRSADLLHTLMTGA
ncbi:Tm-1-like ATP-binding domain-containing protein [Virgisporangium ochraceum]|uniref:Uncharacterized protein n=1 Tax=Virgisporangium ochraceum TaxID=65505 RepID=A0A8J4ECG9_9ACTN|nr:Tm-1-like ATP-binding domain-containing protein [Virgisporangium ochraceum]GIJ69686.1 hypothetical protein Voc01_046030 [Virgisporangium ochraceum]